MFQKTAKLIKLLKKKRAMCYGYRSILHNLREYRIVGSYQGLESGIGKLGTIRHSFSGCFWYFSFVFVRVSDFTFFVGQLSALFSFCKVVFFHGAMVTQGS